MMNSRQDIINVLSDAQVDFPTSATTGQLRNLLRAVVGGPVPGSAEAGDIATNTDAAVNTAVAINADTAAAENSDTAATVNAAAVVNADTAAAVNADTDVCNDFDNAGSNAVVGNSDSAAAECMPGSLGNIDQEVMALRKRLEMLQLMQQIEQLESRKAAGGHRRLDFGEIEHALPKFSGDDVAYPVNHFVRDFEEIMESTGANNNFKLLALRRCLTGTARVFLTTTAALGYDALKGALVKEFDFAVTRQEIYKMLAQRKWKKRDETLHRYVLNMQAIAKRANIAEAEVIDFVIDGIGNAVPNVHLLLTARTIEELKVLISRYQNKYFMTNSPTTVVQKTQQANQPHKTEAKTRWFVLQVLEDGARSPRLSKSKKSVEA
ncbi:PREDICTED: uncharacterized protein LOC108361754 [Rhagoletis zephyria]|uniref:uncharacterized protein LOC108361754 n=1 Tax=Rhagoletis zephyria TaxID=28612 RepID=UPI0008113C6D|nr:PREDICTED: uncharacterized protein LOC108361754 [Rhagoletis zephyria]